MTWFDSHCHLLSCEAPVDELLERARSAGVDELLVVGIDERSSEAALDLARQSGIYAAVGVHPNETSDWDEGRAERIREFAGRPGAVAVGETGLDFYRDAAPGERQREAFRAHIAIARSSDKALVIHTRDSVDAALDELTTEGCPDRLVFHCWSGTRSQLDRALSAGAYVSFAGNVTFKRNSALRELASSVPIDRLLVETDSPYLAPEPFRGRSNEPAHVGLVGACVAEARGQAVEELALATRDNAHRLFRTSPG